MEEFFFTPGPSQLHPQMQDWVHEALKDNICSISHRSKKFEGIYQDTVSNMKALLGIPPSHQVFFLGSATEAMERIVENCTSTASFHFVNGEFSKRFLTIAQQHKKKPAHIDAEPGFGFDLSQSALPESANLICFTQNETSTGVALPEESIHNLKRRFHHKIFAVDIVSSAPVSELNYDLVDTAFFSVQKGFGMPAGLGVLIVNNACMAVANQLALTGSNIGSYHNFLSLAQYSSKNQTPETPNVLAIYLLGKVCAAYREAGIERIRRGVKANAKLLYDFFDAHEWLKPFVEELAFRSATVLTIDTQENALEVKEKLAARGIQVGLGYGPFRNTHIRIANFPTHSTDMVYDLLDALKDLKRPEPKRQNQGQLSEAEQMLANLLRRGTEEGK